LHSITLHADGIAERLFITKTQHPATVAAIKRSNKDIWLGTRTGGVPIPAAVLIGQKQQQNSAIRVGDQR
jgi:hypothetical protein